MCHQTKWSENSKYPNIRNSLTSKFRKNWKRRTLICDTPAQSQFPLYFFNRREPNGYFMCHQVSYSSILHFSRTFFMSYFILTTKWDYYFGKVKYTFLWRQHPFFRPLVCLFVSKYQRLNACRISTKTIVEVLYQFFA